MRLHGLVLGLPALRIRQASALPCALRQGVVDPARSKHRSDGGALPCARYTTWAARRAQDAGVNRNGHGMKDIGRTVRGRSARGSAGSCFAFGCGWRHVAATCAETFRRRWRTARQLVARDDREAESVGGGGGPRPAGGREPRSGGGVERRRGRSRFGVIRRRGRDRSEIATAPAPGVADRMVPRSQTDQTPVLTASKATGVHAAAGTSSRFSRSPAGTGRRSNVAVEPRTAPA